MLKTLFTLLPYPVISSYQGRRYIALSNPQEQLIHTMSPFMFLPPTPKMAVIRSGSSVQCVSVWVMTLLKAKTIAVVRLHSWTPPQHTHCLYVEFTHIQTHASGTSFMAVSQITAAHFQRMRNNFRQNCFEVWWYFIWSMPPHHHHHLQKFIVSSRWCSENS